MLISAILLGAVIQGQNLIVNGSFEEPKLTNREWVPMTGGQLKGWRIDRSTELITSKRIDIPSGSQCILLGQTSSSGRGGTGLLSQSLRLMRGGYTLQLKYRARVIEPLQDPELKISLTAKIQEDGEVLKGVRGGWIASVPAAQAKDRKWLLFSKEIQVDWDGESVLMLGQAGGIEPSDNEMFIDDVVLVRTR